MSQQNRRGKGGYVTPRGSGQGGGSGGGSGTSGVCFKCNRPGHMARDCPSAGGGYHDRPQPQYQPRGDQHGVGHGQRGGSTPRAFGGGSSNRGGGPRLSYVQKGEVNLVDSTFRHRPLGWHELPERQDDIQLPVASGKGTQHVGAQPPRSAVITNHYKLDTNLPPTIYHYTVTAARVVTGNEKSKGRKRGGGGGDVEGVPANPPRNLPKDLMSPLLRIACSRLTQMFQDETGSDDIGVITDFRNTIYSTHELESQVSMEVDVIAADAGIDGDGTFRLTLARGEGDVETTAIQELFESVPGEITINNEMDEAKKRVLQVLSILMKNTGDERFNPVVKQNALMKIPTAREEEEKSLGGGLTIWTGTSMTPVYGWKPFLNVDIDNSAFVKGKAVLEVLAELFPRLGLHDVTSWSPDEVGKASKFLKDCKVRWDVNSSTNAKAVFRVERQSVSQLSFDYNGRKTTVSEYYRTHYDKKLQMPKGPCLRMSNAEGPLVPAELCKIKQGKSINRKLTGDQTSEMINHARKDPGELHWQIENGIEELALRQSELLTKFGVNLNGNMLRIAEARVLKPPGLMYGESRNTPGKLATVTPADGKWDLGRQGEEIKFYNPVTIKTWGILILGQKMDDELNMFVDALIRQARVRGITIGQPNVMRYEGRLNDNLQCHERNVVALIPIFESLKEKLQEEDSFVMVVIPRKGSAIYNAVKQASELYASILTQCVTMNSVRPRRGKNSPEHSVVDNILLKINAKVGGVNHLLRFMTEPSFKPVDILKYPVLIMGIDVNHPSAGLDSIGNLAPSYAAVTGTLDRTGMVHMMHVQAQEKAERGAAEIVQGLDVITENMLRRFRSSTNNQAPHKIIVFRDGVGEGQFKEVLHVEMRAIRAACERLNVSYKPQITFITVQKRHKTRLMNVDNRGEYFSNVEPGTVVDTEIVHGTEMDFYLQSHAVIQGTGRPTRYHLLWDDSDFTADQLQILTYYLCYAYCRCNRSVKIPAPTYYAHWAAYRAKVLAEGHAFESIVEVNKHIQQREAAGFAQKFPFHFV